MNREDWLNQVVEPALEPDLPICDPHHHLWDRPGATYMLDELEQDTKTHNVVSTVFVECMSGYRTEGPDALKPVGETEFVEKERLRVRARGSGFARPDEASER